MILSLEELDNIRVLGLAIFVVTPHSVGYLEINDFRYTLTEDGMICLVDRSRGPNFNNIIAHFGITSQKIKNLKYPDESRLFTCNEEAKAYANAGLHKRSKAYAEAKRTLLCGDR